MIDFVTLSRQFLLDFRHRARADVLLHEGLNATNRRRIAFVAHVGEYIVHFAQHAFHQQGKGHSIERLFLNLPRLFGDRFKQKVLL